MEAFVIDPALVKHLQQVYPDRCPDLDESERTIFFNAGRVSVVRYLEQRLAEQERIHYGEAG